MNTTLSDQQILGIDIGGSHITAGFINLSSGEIIDNRILRKHVDCHASADEILNGWCDAIRESWKENGVKSSRLGFAMPGPFDYKNGISLITGVAKYEAIYKMNIRDELAARLGIPGTSICFRNDAEAFLEGELLYGAAKGFKHAIGITLGTGLGSAISHDGVTTDAELGIHSYKGEYIEDFVSTRGLIRAYREVSGEEAPNAKFIADRYNTDELARKAYDSFSDHLIWFLDFFIQREAPEVLVVGGNIAKSWHLFSDKLQQALNATVKKMPVIKMAALGEPAALIGGAACFSAKAEG